MARPTILTEDLVKNFCAKLRISGSIETAIKASGIGRESYYGWVRKVRDGGGNALQKRLVREVEHAEGEVKLIREHMLSKHFDKNWQALAWWLERKYSPEYGQRRPPPLPDPDRAEEERVIDRIVWAKAPAPGEKKTPDAAATSSTYTPNDDDGQIGQPGQTGPEGGDPGSGEESATELGHVSVPQEKNGPTVKY